MNTPRPRAGFTLVELLVVIAIIAMLLGIVVRSFERIGTMQRRNEAMGRLQSLSAALRAYRQDWGDVPIYNPIYADFNPDSVPDNDHSPDPASEPHGPGLWALVMLDYLSTYRFLNDPASPVELPWIWNQGQSARLEVRPGDPASMEAAYTEWYGPIANPGGDLLPIEQWRVYNLLAGVGLHRVRWPSSPAYDDFGTYERYDAAASENYCSWMMQDAYTGEWKYQPVRRTTPRGAPELSTDVDAGIVPFPVDDDSDRTSPTYLDYYHRQLSHRWTDYDSPLYLPASDTVVTWSSLFRQIERRPAYNTNQWGHDLVLFDDGHVEILPGPQADVGTNPLEGRALLRPAPRQ